PVTRIFKKIPAQSPACAALETRGYRRYQLPIHSETTENCRYAIVFADLSGKRRIVFADSYFTPVEIAQKLLRKRITYTSQPQMSSAPIHRPQVRFYGRQ